MLELRLNADAKRIAAMRAAVAQECRRSKADDAHAAVVANVVEQLIAGGGAGRGKRGRRSEVFVVVTVQSDATMLMVRYHGPFHADLDERRHRLLNEHTASWSTISGAEGRTIWAEIARSTPVPAEPEPAPVAADVPASAHVPIEAPAPVPADVPAAMARVDPELVSVLPPRG
jgi:hypothetical protein